MPTETDLKKATKRFFQKFWNSNLGDPPFWSKHWRFDDSIPNNDRQGCYALINNDEVLYIGAGLGRGTDTYENCGLGYRLKRYWKVNKSPKRTTHYEPRKGWEEISSIITIGFNPDQYCMAAALEIYLINQLNPLKNKHHKKVK